MKERDISTGTDTSNSGPGYARAPGHTLSLAPADKPWTATLNGNVIAKSDNALIMTENKYDPVVYFPMSDVRLDLATATDHSTYCPFKGEASYWSFGDQENIAWCYKTPYDEVIGMKDYVAFYLDRLDSLS